MIDESIVVCKKNHLLLNSILLKLIYYVVFKCEQPNTEAELKKRIIKVNKMLSPSERGAKIVQRVDKLKLKERLQT
jgi:hypothetical protein